MRGEARLGSDGDPLKLTNKKPEQWQPKLRMNIHEMTKVDL